MMRFIVVLWALSATEYAPRPISIGSEAQLFLDDFSVERLTGIRRVLHQPLKRGVIQAKDGEDFGFGGVYIGNIVTRDRSGRFHMLYRFPWDDPAVAQFDHIGVDKAHWFREAVAYAYSDDGVHWEKPKLGLIQGPASYRKDGPYLVADRMSDQNNLGVPIDFMVDLHAHGAVADPQERFLLRVAQKDDTHPFAKVIESQVYFATAWPDILHDSRWVEKLTPIPHGKLHPRGFLRINGFDPGARVWFGVCQDYVGSWTKREGREIARFESPDLVEWSGPKIVLPIAADESKTPTDYVENMDLEAYWVGGPTTGAWLGQLVVFHSDRSNPQYRMPRPFVVWRKGLTELRLVVSRDAGNSWQRVSGKQAWLSPSRDEHGYDRLVFASRPVRVGDELWFYYSAWDGDHLVYNFDGSTYYPDGFLRRVRTARATLRWDGYLSCDAGRDGGALVTKLVTFTGDELVVNVQAAGGELKAELLDENERPLPGFGLEDALPVTGDGIELKVRWRGQASVASVAGKAVRVRFALKNAALYSYQFR
jgi:hypothetical protein